MARGEVERGTGLPVPSLPAVCERCGNVFSSVFGGEDSRSSGFFDNTESCPRCGATARVLEGTFDFIDDVVRVLWTTTLGAEDLRRIQAELTRLETSGASAQEIEATLKREVPALRPLIDKAPVDPTLRYARVMLILTIVIGLLQGASTYMQYLQSVQSVQRSDLSPEDVARIADEVVEKRLASDEP